jgi:hypothetical protein
MRPFTARRSPLHAATGPGKPTLTRRARRRRERIELDKRETLAKLATQREALEVTRELDAYTEEKAERAESRKASTTRQARAALAARLRAFRTRLDNDRPLLAALIVSGLCLVTTIAGQIMVYESLDWHGWSWIGDLLPFIVEGATWTFGIFAAWLASRIVPLPYGRYIRLMWLFASYAAGSNTWHFARDLHDPITGALLGGASIVGPFIWHSYVTLSKLARSGRSAAQIRAALLQRIYHPVLSARTTSLWSAANAAMTRDMAWRLTWEHAKGAAPGLLPARRVVTARNAWLFRVIFGRVVTTPSWLPTATPTATNPQPATATRNPQPATPETGAQPDQPATRNPDDSGLADEVANYLRTWNAPPGATTSGGATATIEQPNPTSSGMVAPPSATTPATPGATTSSQVAGNLPPQPQPTATERTATASDLVAQYYRNQVAAGVAADNVNATRAASFATENGLRCSRQAAAKVINKLRNQGGVR